MLLCIEECCGAEAGAGRIFLAPSYDELIEFGQFGKKLEGIFLFSILKKYLYILKSQLGH